jgi:putative phosphoribosyl transferase
VVLGLPRGGIPVAYEVARELGCLMDVLVVRKVGLPHQRELAMGSIGEGGVVVRNEEVIRLGGVDDGTFDSAVRAERRELKRRVEMYRSEANAVDLEGCTAIVVDDGLATGSTARAAIEVVKERDIAGVWLAVPVAPRDTAEDLERVADRVVVLETPRRFGAVGAWYRDFSQTSDDEVRSLLSESRLR